VIYLFDQTEQAPIKFDQDHCRDRDYGHCRKLHLRVSATGKGWGRPSGAVENHIIGGRRSNERRTA
jgi:hypothetical protein